MKSLPSFLALFVFCLSGAAHAAPLSVAVDKAQSRVDILVKATGDSFTGKLTDYQARVTVDTDTGTVATAEFDFDFTAIKTGRDDRDREMHEWQKTPKFPTGQFRLTSLEPPDSGGRRLAKGTFSMHGQTREISFPVSVTVSQQTFSCDGEALIDTREYGLPIIRKFAILKVDARVRVKFHLQGTLDVR